MVTIIQRCLVLFIFAFYSSISFSQEVTEQQNTEIAIAEEKTEEQTLSPSAVITYPKNPATNNIPYFDNRFRIDAQIKEATLVFFRRSGSAPIILVQPDGSKLKVNSYPKDKVEWFDDVTYDMIKLKDPMRGPWQALGDILPNSEIMVVSDVTIEVDLLPEILLSGETLKITGKLINGDQYIKAPEFKDVVSLEVTFTSTNNPDYENFGADTEYVTEFKDDGRDLDEYANDGLFTGEFLLDIAPGEWSPKYTVKLPMVTREQKQERVILQPNPVKIDIKTTRVVGEDHIATFAIDPTYVDIESMVFQGKIVYPNLKTASFSILEPSKVNRVKAFVNKEAGVHRMKVSAFGKTIEGREFSLNIPEFVFNVQLPEEKNTTTVEASVDNPEDSITSEIDALLNNSVDLPPPAEEDDSILIWLFIGLGNLVILIIGGALIWRVNKKKPIKK